MRRLDAAIFLTVLMGVTAHAQERHGPSQVRNLEQAPLDVRIGRFNVGDAILRDGISELSLKNVPGLHLGFEEIIRERIQDDPRAPGMHFSLHLENKSVKQILDALCAADRRYTWSKGGLSINVYPIATRDNQSYLLNQEVNRIRIQDIPDPDQALTPLSKLFPEQQVGYFGPGLGSNAYGRPWTADFEHLPVRQFIDKIAEHMGSQTTWVWGGGKDERMFTFFKGGFHASRPDSDSANQGPTR